MNSPGCKSGVIDKFGLPTLEGSNTGLLNSYSTTLWLCVRDRFPPRIYIRGYSYLTTLWSLGVGQKQDSKTSIVKLSYQTSVFGSDTVRNLIKNFFLIALGGGIGLLVLFTNPIQLYERGGLALLWAYAWRGGVATAILWLGNAYLSMIPDRWYTWTEAPVRRLFFGIVITIVFTCFAWVFIEWMFSLERFGWNFGALLKSLSVEDFVPALIITFFISIFMHGRGFLLGWKETLIETEKLKKEHISAQYETLKSQVNPHFLFNSLNVLSSLVHKDADLADQFIRRLSTVYRYILESRDQEVVTLKEELEILKAYLFLMDIRFGNSLQASIDLPENIQGQVAPLTLQMLVENALKHNEVSKANPLQIDIYTEENRIIVRNNLQPKNTLPSSTGIGLANIQARYQVLSNEEVLISDTDGYFTVNVPIL